MSYWHYCQKCNEGMPMPNLRESIRKTIQCYHCGHEHRLSAVTCEAGIQEFEERFERMEKFLAQYMPKE